MNSATLTIRLPQEQRDALRRAAAALKKTESQYIRDLLARDMDSVPFGERLGDLVGCLDSSAAEPTRSNAFRDRIRANNWRR